MASLLSLRGPERPNTLAVGSIVKSNGTSSQKLTLLDEYEDEGHNETLDASVMAAPVQGTQSTSPAVVAFSLGDSSPPEPVSLARPRSTQWLNKVPESLSEPRKISTCSEPALQSESSALSSNAASPMSETSPVTEALTLPRPPLTSSSSVERRKKAGNILVAALKGGFSGSGSVVDEENSTDSNSTADDDSLREKKKKTSIFQPLKKKNKSKVT